MKTKTLIEKLEEVMYDKFFTQEQLAKRLYVRFATVNRWFNGHTLPNKRSSFKIRKFIHKYTKGD